MRTDSDDEPAAEDLNESQYLDATHHENKLGCVSSQDIGDQTTEMIC